MCQNYVSPCESGPNGNWLDMTQCCPDEQPQPMCIKMRCQPFPAGVEGGSPPCHSYPIYRSLSAARSFTCKPRQTSQNPRSEPSRWLAPGFRRSPRGPGRCRLPTARSRLPRTKQKRATHTEGALNCSMAQSMNVHVTPTWLYLPDGLFLLYNHYPPVLSV